MFNELDDVFVKDDEMESLVEKVTKLEEEQDTMQDGMTWGTL
jgi:uncharacterized protein Yka (UPF0111/DUF47 family)